MEEKKTTFCEGYTTCLHAVRSKTSGKIEYGFYRYGVLAGSHPLWVAGLSLFICLAAGSGLWQWRGGLSDLELYMPVDSPVRTAAGWVQANFPDDLRYETIIVEADNVLEPEVLAVMAELENDVKTVIGDGKTWKEVCARYTTWFQKNASISDLDIPPAVKSNLEKEGLIKDDCLYQSPLRAWPEGTLPEPLSKEAALATINKSARSKTNIFADVTPLLSGVKRNSTNHIVSAKAAILIFLLKESEPAALAWEGVFIEKMLERNKTAPPGVKVYAIAKRSYYDILAVVMDSNMTIMCAGYSLIIIYVIVMLGRFNRLHQRIYISMLGVSIAGQALAAAYGVCFYLGFFYGPVHPILPFLLLGVGVDDMFVIADCLDNIKKKHKHLSVPERIGEGLRSSGISITVTSFTDILAFAVGTTTRMPFLRSFCVFSTFGIFFLWLFQLLFFVSVLALDEYRVESRRDGCLCIKMKNWKPSAFMEKYSLHTVFKDYIGTTLMKNPVRILVLVTTVVLASVSTWGIFQIERKFDPIWYIDAKSYPILFNDKLNQYFPTFGTRAGVYIGGLDYFNDADQLQVLTNSLNANPYINHATTKVWFTEFGKWLKRKHFSPDSEEEFRGYLSEYLLLTRSGQGFIKDIKFSKFPFNEYNITVSQIPLQFVMLNTTAQKMEVVKSMDDMITAMNLTRNQKVVSYSPDYVPWYTDEIIGQELMRNLGLTFAAVAAVTLLMIQELQTTMWVLVCVVFTLVDLVGSMYFLGLTIEISSSILVLICAGLSVDYAAHIGYEFYKTTGSGKERAILTLGHMGPAVFNGGFSTFLAFALLGFSEAYIFNTFFKLFTSVVVYGLFHGMVFLPVILSLVGPTEKQPSSEKYSTSDKKSTRTMNGIYVSTKNVMDCDESLPVDVRNAVQENLLPSAAVGNTECRPRENGSAQEPGKW